MMSGKRKLLVIHREVFNGLDGKRNAAAYEAPADI
jgi:hypothetical protein